MVSVGWGNDKEAALLRIGYVRIYHLDPFLCFSIAKLYTAILGQRRLQIICMLKVKSLRITLTDERNMHSNLFRKVVDKRSLVV